MNILEMYNNGKSIKEISITLNKHENEVRNFLKSKINWYSKTISDLNEVDFKNILSMYEQEFSVIEISDIFKISAPSIIKILNYKGIKKVYHKGRKYDILKQTPFSKKEKEFIVGTLLGDACIRKNGKIPRMCLVHSKKYENYFHWKIMQMEKYFNLWREKEDKRKNTTLLYTETLQHNGLNNFYKMFYKNGKKIIPDNLDIYMTPYSLCVWYLDDGTLNDKTNYRIYTNCFEYNDQIKLQSLIKRCFDLDCNIIKRKDNQHYLSFNSKNSNKMTKIIEPYVIDSMKYKIKIIESSTTTCQNSLT